MPHGDSTTYIRLRSGRKFWPLDPHMVDIDVRDIAYGLAGQYRYAGHSRLTVAQHSVVGSCFMTEDSNRLPFLAHDVPEGLGFCDCPSPVKRTPGFAAYCKAEKNCLMVVCEAWKVKFPFTKEVAYIDDVMARTEMKLILGWKVGAGYVLNFSADQQRVWGPEEAEERFLRRYSELTGEVVADLDWFGAKSALSVLLPPTKLAARIADTALRLPDPPRPPNSFTQAEYARDNAVSIHTATRSIKKLYEAGRVKPVKFKTRRSDGQVTMVAGWELVEEGGKQ